jgi:hypothetical protein
MASAPSPRRAAAPGVALFAAAIFAGAFLVFLVQPMVGKRILPWFGGAPGVWMLCLAFFQTTLFLGYAYAHVLVRCVPVRLHLLVHGVLVIGALLALPVLPGEGWKPDPSSEPGARILLMLVANVGAPFLLLASTGPLVQWWFARALPGRSPYPLYAVSNLGSLLALVGYPFLVEPRFALSHTSELWSWGLALAALAILACGAWAGRTPELGGAGARGDRAGGDAPGAGRVVLWFLLAGGAVVQLMGATNRLCLDIASVPFLWILPLCLYLATFILCFSSVPVYRRGLFVPLWIAALAVLEGAEHELLPGALAGALGSLRGQLVLHPLALFAGCMVAHGELFRLRPAPRGLTAYYLCLSAGGALGGMFVGLLAPRVFSGYHEQELGVALVWLAALAALARDPSSFLSARRALAWPAAALLTLALGGAFAARALASRPNLLHEERNFFGILRVLDVPARRADQQRTQLWHGSTVHGVQYIEGRMRREPTAYFGRLTGIGLLMDFQNRREPRRAGVVGLGIGTLAAYARPRDRMTFYEIDPDVVRVAEDERFFDYLARSPGEVDVVLGDGRLSLEAEASRADARPFDVLVLDAFSSDSIPVHLLTREAFALYERLLAPAGLLAVHVSNRHLDLAPLVLRVGTEVGLHGMAVHSGAMAGSETAVWVLLAREPNDLDAIVAYGASRRDALGLPRAFHRFDRTVDADAPLWTDDYSDLFGVLLATGEPGSR